MNGRRRFSLVLVVACIGAIQPHARGQDGDSREASADEARERKVMERFAELLERTPRRGTALDRVYGYHVERGTLEPFVKAYRDRTAKDPNDGRAWLILGLVESQRGRDGAAVAAFRECEKVRPDDPLPSYYLGQSLVLIGQPDAAAEAFERAISRKPSRQELLEIYQALGRIYQRAHRNEQALAVWNRLETQFPDDLRVKEQIADILAEESQHAQALPRYEALIARVKDPYRKVQLQTEAAELKVRLGRSNDALADFERLLGQLNPENWLYREVRRKVEEVYLRNDDLAGLATYYEGWIKRSPEDVDALARLGKTLAQQGRTAEARGWLEKAVKLAPRRRELRLALIDQLVLEKKIGDAEAQYEALSKNEPNNPDVLREWGKLVLRDSGRPEDERKKAAAVVWRRLVVGREKDAVATAQLADLFRQAEMVDDAIALYKEAIALAPESPQYREYLGEYYHTLKRGPEALAVWREIAEGKNRNAKSLARLSQVLAGFGYRQEALAPISDACALDPDNFDLRTDHAELLIELDRFKDALAQLEAAAKVADSDEQREGVLALRIKAYIGSNTLAEQIASLKKDLDAGKEAIASRWLMLARYLEAEQNIPEATAAVVEATRRDERFVPAWLAAARIQEAAGNFSAASDALRKLTQLDRRNRAEYLTTIAKLEARLGRRDAALQAGRDLLAASPSNPETHQFFADLCFQLGDAETGLDALRRSVRANPGDAKVALSLAGALAQQFRTDEAVELHWRAFDKTKELDAKLGIVARLTDLALQQNQFDRLIARLERLALDQGQQREMTICLAQAYQSSGDFGTARQTLEKLLGANTRDTPLFQQLATLAESEGDYSAAAKYQRQVCEFAPSDEAWGRLAQLYVRAGDASEAEVVWTKLAGGDRENPARVLQAIDSLISSGKREAVLANTDRLIRANPRNWEALYREGATLAALNRNDEAARRFQAIVDLRFGDGEQGELAKSFNRPTAARAAGTPATATAAMRRALIPIQMRVSAALQIRLALGLEDRAFYGMQSYNWSPTDFGQARMAALAWLYKLGPGASRNESFLKRCRDAKDRSPQDPRALWDWCYLQLVLQDTRETYPTAKALARVSSTDPEALWLYLYALSGRAANPNQSQVVVTPSVRGAGAVDSTPPLPNDDLEFVLTCFRGLKLRRPEWAQATVVANVITELKRAKRSKEEREVYDGLVANANDPTGWVTALNAFAQSGDVDAILGFVDRIDRSQTGGASGYQTAGRNALTISGNYLGRAMAARAEAKAHGDILKLYDRYVEMLRRHQQPAGRSRSAPTASYGPRGYSYRVWQNSQQIRASQIDFPAPNDRYDMATLSLLRNAFEIYRRDDLSSDLVEHLRSKTTQGSDSDRVFAALGLCYVQWWSDEKDEAVKTLSQAAELAGSDADIKLTLAELRERRNEPDEALAAIESIESLDNSTMQRRETAALRVSVASGNIDRARLAAERLFGLRLDTDTQVQLASQMHQLGMHELAEAVMARARHRAGNRTAALVSLMSQYVRQNKQDIAVQIAHQILRKAPMQQAQPGIYDQEEVARREALQVLSRSGKLKELTERLEAQARAAGNSLAIQQTLADYYRAAGDRTKAAATVETIGKLRPEDAKLQFQVAFQLVELGNAAAATEHFRSAIKKEPALFGNQYWEVENAFRQANKFDELLSLIEGLDVSRLGNPYSVSNIALNLIQDPKSRDRGMKLFRKLWQGFPTSARSNLVRNLFYNYQLWQLPEIYDYARESVIPDPQATQVTAWSGFDSIVTWEGDGKVVSLASRLLEAAAKQGKTESLRKEVDAALQRVPDWSSGQALRAILLARSGRSKEAREILKPLVEQNASTMSSDVRWALGQELENFGPLADLAEPLFNGAMGEDYANRGLMYPNHPARRLIVLYERSGRLAKARDLLLKVARQEDLRNYSDPNQNVVQNANRLSAVASELLTLGFPVDAVHLFAEMISETERLPDDNQYGSYKGQLRQQSQDGIARALDGLSNETLTETVGGLLKPKPDAKPGELVLDLVLLVQPREADKAEITSLLATIIRSAADSPKIRTNLESAIGRLVETYPDDLSAQVTATLLALADGKPERIDGATVRLTRLLDRLALDDLKGARPNARQRAEASRQLGLWLVARECWKHDPTHAVGNRFAERAVEAAKRQADPIWALAMLREWGQSLLDRGDPAAAEKRWSDMLDRVLISPATKATAGANPSALPMPPAQAAPTPAAPRPAPATPKSAPAEKSAPATKIKKTSQLTKQRRATGKAAAPSAASQPVTRAKSVPTLTTDRFVQAMQVAKLAARQGMHALSLRAVREALKGGPPIGGASVNQPIGTTAVMTSSGIRYRPAASGGTGLGMAQPDAAFPIVEAQIAELDRTWRMRNAPAKLVYETLRDALMPASRPTELFLYPRPATNRALADFQSAGSRLVYWAVRAGTADDLKAHIEARRGSTTAAFNAMVLLAQLGVATRDEALARRELEAIVERLKKDTLATTAELACLAARPALDVKATSDVAARVLDLCVKSLALQANVDEPLGSLYRLLTRHYREKSQLAEMRSTLRDYLAAIDHTSARYSGDSAVYRRRLRLRQVAAEYVLARSWPDALELLGEYADTAAPRFNEAALESTIAALAQHLQSLPPPERYKLLEAWTMPAANRRSVRLLAGFLPGLPPPAPVFGATIDGKPTRDEELPEWCREGFVSTADILIDAARQANRLDELADALRKLAGEKVENAEALSIVADVARGRGKDVAPRIRPILDRLKTMPVADPNSQAQRRVDWPDFLVFHACLREPSLASEAEALGSTMIELAKQPYLSASPILTHLLRDVAVHAGASANRADSSNSTFWNAGTIHNGPFSQSAGVRDPLWAVAEGHISHPAGPGPDFLIFDVPLAGTFEFSFDVYHRAWSDAGFGFGGLFYERGLMQKLGGRISYRSFAADPPQPFFKDDAFNRITISVTPERTRYFVNGHAVHEETEWNQSSPYFTFNAKRDQQTHFRNLAITGAPRVLSEVALIHDDTLDAWAVEFYNETKYFPHRTAARNNRGATTGAASAGSAETFDWRSEKGIVTGRLAETAPSVEPAPSFLYYVRPIRAGDAISYEFYYEPGICLAHPAIGRIAFVLDADRVRLHWLTGSTQDDWTGLPLDNVVEDPVGRLPLAKLPLVESSWNRATLSLTDKAVELQVNGVPVYRRSLDADLLASLPEYYRHFGFYHDKNKTEAKVRNVVLRGDWPKELRASDLADLTRHWPVSAIHDDADMIGDAVLSQNAHEVLRRARALSPADRYAPLASWVLPGPAHSGFRVQGDFTPADVAPPVAPRRGEPVAGRRIHTGGDIDAPAIELVATAKATNRLDELAERVTAAAAATDLDRRSQAALLVLIRIAQGRDREAGQGLERLRGLVTKLGKDDRVWSRWPELIASSTALERPELRESATQLLEAMVKQVDGHSLSGPWVRHVHHALAVGQVLGLPADGRARFGDDPQRAFWAPVVYGRARERGEGNPRAHWSEHDGAWSHYPGHESDALYFGVPLLGDFELTCELSARPGYAARIAYAGQSVAMKPDGKSVELSQSSRPLPDVMIEPPIAVLGNSYHYRLVVREGTATSFVNDRKVMESSVPSNDRDPWVAIQTTGDSTAVVKGFKITGSPSVPKSIGLTSLPDLTGWLADYYEESVAGPTAAWEKRGEELFGRSTREPTNPASQGDYIYTTQAGMLAASQVSAGSRTAGRMRQWQESILQYHRPMLEDGEIEYEFFYEPGKVNTHPALDRLTFLLEPEGVAIHWLTDAQHDRTGLKPDNRTIEPDRRRGPASLPLKASSWNRVRLSLTGDLVTLELNGTRIYERALNPANQRNFGLFHYADDTVVRVRNVKYTGHWPNALPGDLFKKP